MSEVELVHCVPNLTEDNYDLIETMWSAYNHDYCPNYASLEQDTGKTKKELKQLLEPFKKLGFIKSVKGLMTEDGEVAGSGFWVNGLQANQLLELAMFRYNYNDRPMGKSEDFVPKTLTVGEYTYKLVPANEVSHD
jgi:hypothetical protein